MQSLSLSCPDFDQIHRQCRLPRVQFLAPLWKYLRARDSEKSPVGSGQGSSTESRILYHSVVDQVLSPDPIRNFHKIILHWEMKSFLLSCLNLLASNFIVWPLALLLWKRYSRTRSPHPLSLCIVRPLLSHLALFCKLKSPHPPPQKTFSFFSRGRMFQTSHHLVSTFCTFISFQDGNSQICYITS